MAIKKFKNNDVLDTSSISYSGSSLTVLLNKLSNIGISINNRDLNECIGSVIIGYGNNCANRPGTQNGYLINIPHPDEPMTYNKQIWLERINNTLFIRRQENGVWSSWTQI